MLDAMLTLFREFFLCAAYVSNSSFPEPLAPDKEKVAIAQMLDGDEAAREKLIEHNLRLVAHVAKKYATAGRETDDLVSIGTIGLIKAVTTFKSGRGTQLATYAARCIDNAMQLNVTHRPIPDYFAAEFLSCAPFRKTWTISSLTITHSMTRLSSCSLLS